MLSPFLGGFECSSHRRRDGRRVDVMAATAHDRLAAHDYSLLRRHGLTGARDGMGWHVIEPARGHRDWHSLDAMIDAGRRADVTVIWDVLHYGWPDWISPWDADFPARFADFAGAAAARIGPGGHYVPINEISFLSWGGGEVGYLNPFDVGRGDALKRILCAAAIAASRAIRAADPGATLITAEPLIHADPDPDNWLEAVGINASQFDAVDMLLGRRDPALGGAESLIDVVGLNYYPYNQFTVARETLLRGDPRYRQLRNLLVDAAAHVRKPLLIAETGCEGADRPAWLRYVAEETRAANRDGAGVRGICLYPILNHPGWDDDRYCPNGLFCGVVDERTPYAPLVEELARQQAIGIGLGHDEMALLPA